MNHWPKRLLALAAPLLLTGCLWGPGKFASDLVVKRDGTFTLDYHGEIVIQLPPDSPASVPWVPSMGHCFTDGKALNDPLPPPITSVNGKPVPKPQERPCSAAEQQRLKQQYEASTGSRREEMEGMAKMFGLPGLDEESNKAFAAKLMKYAGWRSVTYRGKGVFDVDYHMEGTTKQDFVFPALPDNNLIVPFITIRRRSDGSVLVTAPEFTGGIGPLGAGAGAAAAKMKQGDGPVSQAKGRFTVVTDGEILTNNSEDGPAPHPQGRQLHWDVGPDSNKIPETLIRL